MTKKPWQYSRIGKQYAFSAAHRLPLVHKDHPCFNLHGHNYVVEIEVRGIGEALRTVCDENGLPCCKLHGLRMLDPSVFVKMPLASADSTNIARNIGIDSAWRGSYQPISKDIRAAILRKRIEGVQSRSFYGQLNPALGVDLFAGEK